MDLDSVRADIATIKDEKVEETHNRELECIPCQEQIPVEQMTALRNELVDHREKENSLLKAASADSAGTSYWYITYNRRITHYTP